MARVFLEYQGDNIELPVGETVIGRDVSCTLRFNDPSVSRRHLRLVRRQDHVFVQDLGSTNGTLVNHRRVDGALRLDPGDEVSIGNRRLVVRMFSSEDDDQPDTLTLKNLDVPEELARIRSTTTRMVTVPPLGAVQHAPPPRPSLEARRHDRHRFELDLVYVSEALEVEATTRDLSVSGVFVCTQLLDPVGTRCQLTILIDGGPPLQLGAIVRRVVEHDPLGDEPVGMGVEFEHVSQEARAWLESTVARFAAAS